VTVERLAGSPLLPAALCALLVALDVAVIVIRNRGGAPVWWASRLGWAFRPLAALAAWNALFRAWPATFKFNPLTFPLYANLWSQSGADPSGQLPRTLLAMAAALVVIIVLRETLRRGAGRRKWLLILWAALVGAQLAVALAPRGWHGLVLPWTAEGKGYAWAARRVERAGGTVPFLRDYHVIQPLQPVHARSHPPGATLLSRWTQNWKTPGVPGNVLRLLLLSSLNLPLVYLLALRALGRERAAVAAAALFGVMPAAAAYGTYSQDTFYSLFFGVYLLLSWRIAHRENSLPTAAAAGVVLYCLSMLTFSWSIAAAACFSFVFLTHRTRGVPLRRSILPLCLPPLVMLLLHALTLLLTDFSYYASYREAYVFHSRYYPFAGARDWVLAFVGGQLELLWAMGPLVASAFLAALVLMIRRREREPFHLLFWPLLACYGVAVIFGPNPLKLETARCWYWILPFPVIAAAGYLDAISPGDDRPLLLAAGTSIAVTLLSLSFLNFGA
jgi:hypothetical protein